jgi:uncharacterized protein YlaI
MTTLQPSLNLNSQLADGPTSFMTERNEHEVRCGMCAREVYVDDETYRVGSDAMNSGPANPFRCEVCADQYDDLTYEVESLCALSRACR